MEKRFMRIIMIFGLIVILSNNIYSQRFNRQKKPKSNVEKFILAPFTEVIDKDSVRIITFIEIPYSSLQFVKVDDLFLASYQASIGVKNKKDKDLDYQVWTDTIKVLDYVDTKTKIKNRKHFTSFNLPIGDKYQIIGELQDRDTRKKGIVKKKIDLSSYSKKPKLMASTFLLDLNGDWGFQKDKIPTKGFKVREIGDGVDLQISGFVKPEDFSVNLFLTNGTANDSLIQRFTGNGNNGFFNEYIFIPSNKFTSLKNDFKIVLEQGKKSDVEEITFSTYKTGISNFVNDIDLALKQMNYLLTKEERSSLKGQNRKEKEQSFYSFWKIRDPTTETDYNELMEEYYTRVWYANEHFDAWESGWETDLGKIYILFGPPDEIQRTNQTSSSSALYQVWSYNKISKKFVFRDQNGFGDYRLDTPFLGAGL